MLLLESLKDHGSILIMLKFSMAPELGYVFPMAHPCIQDCSQTFLVIQNWVQNNRFYSIKIQISFGKGEEL